MFKSEGVFFVHFVDLHFGTDDNRAEKYQDI
jgi:hypothetical protein